jgi:DNA ligase (NAD+)
MRDGTQISYKFPAVCPVCGSLAERKSGEVAYRCTNKKCFAQVRRQIIHFVAKDAFNIDGLGPKIIDRLLDEGLINDAADLFSLTKGDLQPLERFAEKSIGNLINSIQTSRELSLDKLIFSLGIRHVGQQTAYDLARHFQDLGDLTKVDMADLQAIEGIGEVVAQSIINYFQDGKNIDFINKLLRSGVKYRKIKEERGLVGKTFVITGTLPNYSRPEAGRMIRQQGGKVSSSVSAKTDYLLAGEKPGSKYEKARLLGVKIVDEKEFKKLLDGGK